jgi:hypothetical protein
MYTLGFVLLFGGMLIEFVAFIIALLNMNNALKVSFSNVFSNHIGAMIFMGIGGLASVSGFIIIAVTILKEIFS